MDIIQLAHEVHDHIDREFDAHLELTRQIIRQRSISADGSGIEEMTRMLKSRLEQMGLKAEIVATTGYPVVFGELNVGAPRTLLIYGMYDTMPVEGEQWLCDPFEAKILDLPDFGPAIVARGAENSKGPLGCSLNVLESWLAVHGKPPVNMKYIFEGEEELGSPSLPGFVDGHQEKLKADGGVFPSLTQNRSGKPVLMLGFKGILFLELYVCGGEWGAPSQRPAHSSRAVWYDSPSFVLTHALSSMISPDQKRILIDGFYDDVAPIPQEDEPLLEQLAKTIDLSTFLVDDGVDHFKWDLPRIDLLKKYIYEPSLNIDGIQSGYVGAGAKTILPHDAYAKIDFRFVPNQRADKILEQVKGHLRKHGFPQIEVHLHDTTLWAKTSVTAPVVQAAIQACRDLGAEPEVWPNQAGSAPMYLFTETLSIPMTPAGMGQGGGAHGPNEYATVEGLRQCEKALASFMAHFAAG